MKPERESSVNGKEKNSIKYNYNIKPENNTEFTTNFFF